MSAVVPEDGAPQGRVEKVLLRDPYATRLTPPPVPQTRPPAQETRPPVPETRPPVPETRPPVPQTRPPVPQTRPPEHRVEVTPAWHFRLGRRGSFDGLTRVRNGVLHRLLHVDERPVLVRIAQLSSGNVLFGASEPRAIAMMRRALWIDADLAPFHRLYRHDPWIGAAVRANPTVRPMGRPYAFEALAAAVTEQLIEFERATAIQRRIHAHCGRLDATTRMRDSATAAAIAGLSPARLESFDLSGRRAIALTRVAREVALGRVDLDTDDRARQEAGWRRLAQIPTIGAWTIEMTALTGQGRIDQIPAGDLGFIKLAGQLASGGDPRARGTEEDVRALFERFGEWKGLAGAYALRSAGVTKSALLR